MFYAGLLGVVGTLLVVKDPVVLWLCVALAVIGGLCWWRFGNGD